jgi:hypothetical protein
MPRKHLKETRNPFRRRGNLNREAPLVQFDEPSAPSTDDAKRIFLTIGDYTHERKLAG